MTRRIVIDFAPRGLSADEAARYIGVGRTTFEELVAPQNAPPEAHWLAHNLRSI
jgi:hypothetical protein